jgi:hypothetical protein
MVSGQSQHPETAETLLPLSVIHDRVACWPEHLRDAWEERAAIIEFDAGETRETAERQAYVAHLAEAASAERMEDGE